MELFCRASGGEPDFALSSETSAAAPSFETPGGYVGQARRLRLAGRFTKRQLCRIAATESLRGRQAAPGSHPRRRFPCAANCFRFLEPWNFFLVILRIPTTPLCFTR